MTNLLVGWVLFGLVCLLAIGVVFLTGWLIYPRKIVLTEEESDEPQRPESLRTWRHER